jgi:hypothetical protein
VGCAVSIDSETLLITDFVNLKIQSVQSFRGAHKDRVHIHIFIEMSAHTHLYMYEYLYLYCISERKVHYCYKQFYSGSNSARHGRGEDGRHQELHAPPRRVQAMALVLAPEVDLAVADAACCPTTRTARAASRASWTSPTGRCTSSTCRRPAACGVAARRTGGSSSSAGPTCLLNPATRDRIQLPLLTRRGEAWPCTRFMARSARERWEDRKYCGLRRPPAQAPAVRGAALSSDPSVDGVCKVVVLLCANDPGVRAGSIRAVDVTFQDRLGSDGWWTEPGDSGEDVVVLACTESGDHALGTAMSWCFMVFDDKCEEHRVNLLRHGNWGFLRVTIGLSSVNRCRNASHRLTCLDQWWLAA